MPATTKPRPNRIQFLQNLIDHPRTSPEERAAAERALARVRAAEAAAGDSAERQGGARPNGLPMWYGEKYDRKLTVTEIAALIRQDIKLARKLAAKAGPDDGPGTVKLPNPIGDAPAGVKFSVRSRHGNAIDITVQNTDPAWAWTTKDHNGHPVKVPTETMRTLAVELKTLGNAYNFDGSDITTDYFHRNYYLSLRIESTDGYWGNA
ncbi:hypothetical protein [Streptomyces sp. NRRL B-24484]|uniref:hypothetical protein n=1 Tax=Streptomyces sp. NRRL B-24484 TaxID=1463833 RepID=UPI0004BEB779|nr:hypothetical protein [Streptomyces sp. NRRL B-24484]